MRWHRAKLGHYRSRSGVEEVVSSTQEGRGRFATTSQVVGLTPHLQEYGRFGGSEGSEGGLRGARKNRYYFDRAQ